MFAVKKELILMATVESMFLISSVATNCSDQKNELLKFLLQGGWTLPQSLGEKVSH